MKFFSAVLLSTTLLAACSNSSPMVKDSSLQITKNTVISLTKLTNASLALGAIHLFYDPLAPNWEVEETRLNDDTYQFSLRMKRYFTGGAGESMQILKRRASQLQLDQGYGNYQLLEYTEGVESETLGARRVAQGVVKLVQRHQADSFSLNERH